MKQPDKLKERAIKALIMLVTALLFISSFIWSGPAAAAPCATNYRLYTQAEVDALGATGCDSIPGYLHIRETTEITNLDGLANLTSVGSLLITDNAALTNVDGLLNLTTTEMDLDIRNNPVLRNLNGLGNLTSVGARLIIYNNPALTNLNALANLTTVGGWEPPEDRDPSKQYITPGLIIRDNRSLINVNGLISLSRIEGRLDILGNAALRNVDGLINLTIVEKNLEIKDNPALSNVNGLANLTSVGGYLLLIRDNRSLTNVDGLVSLANVAGSMTVSNNSALSNLDGLVSLTSIGGSLNITYNPALTSVNGPVNLTSVGSGLKIYQNPALANLNGLANLTSAGHDLEISYNDALRNVDGLANLTSVGGSLSITDNPALASVNGLFNLTSVGDYLAITNNSVLEACEGVAPLLGWPNGPPLVPFGIFIRNNSIGCNSVAEVLASVSGPTQPIITNAVARDGGIELEFRESITFDALFPITSYDAACKGSAAVNESPAVLLLDNTPVSRTIRAPSGLASQIEVDVNITHSRPEHLYIALKAANGTEVVLWDRGYPGTENLVGTFPTTLTPIESFSSLVGQSTDGNWVLYIEDVVKGPLVREGVLNSWGLRITEELATNGRRSPIELRGGIPGSDYRCTVSPVTALGVRPVSAPYYVTVPPPTLGDRFNSLLQTVKNIRGAHGEQKTKANKAESIGALTTRQLSKEEPNTRSTTEMSTDHAVAIPTLPYFLMPVMICLIGLSGLHRLKR